MRAFRKLKSRPSSSRRGTATVEFAIIAPVFMTLALGVWEMGTAVTASNNLTAGVREGGRLASMDFTGKLAPGQTPNQKVIQDIRAFLAASGIPSSYATVTLTHADGAKVGQTFDLADPDNYMQLFSVKATVPYGQISMFPTNFMAGQTLRAELVFRRGRSTIQQ